MQDRAEEIKDILMKIKAEDPNSFERFSAEHTICFTKANGDWLFPALYDFYSEEVKNPIVVGLLQEGVSMESIKHGASVPRNKLLFNHGINLLPYTGAGSGITRALKFTPDIKFVNDEMLNEFVVTVERRNVGETEAKNDRYSDREDRDKRDEEGRDNSLSSKCIENNEATKRDNDGAEETEDRARVVRTPYKQLPSVQKDIIHFCAIPRTVKEIMDHIGYYNNSKNMTTYVRPLLEMGYLEMTEPDKPQSKNQKYRKVRKD